MLEERNFILKRNSFIFLSFLFLFLFFDGQGCFIMASKLS